MPDSRMILELVGVPSGQILSIHYVYLNMLYSNGYIRFEPELNSWIFKDENYEKIKNYIESPEIW